MSDAWALYLVLVVIYLLDCVVWVRADAVAFRSGLARRHIVRGGSRLPGNERGGFLALNPLPPLGSLVVCQQWPVSAGHEGIYSYVSLAFNPGPRPLQRPRYLRYEEIHSAGARDAELLVDGAVLARTASAQFARHLASTLRGLRDAAPGERESRVRSAVRSSMDLEAAGERVQAFQKLSGSLRLYCNALFVHLYVLAPVVLAWRGLPATGIPLLLGLLLGVALILWEFHGIHRDLYPDDKAGRRLHLVTMALAPPSAIRALDAVSRDLLADRHPLAAAHVLCSREDFLAFGRRVLLDAAHPVPPVCPSESPWHLAAEQEFRTIVLEEVWGLMRRAGGDPEILARPLSPEAPGCRAYCPRCDGQYAVAQGTCTDCGGMGLLAFDPAASGGRP